MSGNRTRYVEALTLLARLGTLTNTRPAVGMAGPRLITRVRRLLEGEPIVSMPLARTALVVAASLLVSAVLPTAFTSASRHLSAQLVAEANGEQGSAVPLGLPTILKTQFAAYYRASVRRHTARAMRQKAQHGHVIGGRTFGYDNVREGPGKVVYRINRAEAAIVREVYERFAEGEGARTVARALNAAAAPSPRAQQGRPCGWSVSTIRAVLGRDLYRGWYVRGKTKKAYGRELLRARRATTREKGQVPTAETTWVRLEMPDLRIIDADLAARVHRRLEGRRSRYLASVARGGRVPERAHGKYLLSGGMLVCPTCGGHFEARKHPWKGHPGDIYICATRRRKPGVCSNEVVLSIAHADASVLDVIEGDVLQPRIIDALLATVHDRNQHWAAWTAERDTLKTEVGRLVAAIGAGVSPETVAPRIGGHDEKSAQLGFLNESACIRGTHREGARGAAAPSACPPALVCLSHVTGDVPLGSCG